MSGSLEEKSFCTVEKEDGKVLFRCLLCGRILSSKQRVLYHLTSLHNFSPPKRVKKRYLDDPSIEVPKRTLYWRKKNKNIACSSEKLDKDEHMYVDDNLMMDSSEKREQEKTVESTCDPTCIAGEDCDKSESESLEHLNFYGYQSPSTDAFDALDNDNDFDLSDSYNSSSDTDSTSDADSSTTDFDDSDSETSGKSQNTQGIVYSESEQQSLCILSYVLRHNLTGAAGKDLVCLMQALFPNDPQIMSLSYSKVIEQAAQNNYKEFHYCHRCNEVYPEEGNIYKCTTPNCGGLRYTGGVERQMISGRNPRCSFFITDIKSHLVKLFQRTEIWNCLLESKKQTAEMVKCSRPEKNLIQDITDAECYKELCKQGEFLSHPHNFSGIFNTDGVPLYSSTKVKLWPIFIALNELRPSIRFARENMILAGIWQGKSRPPFFQYIASLGDIIVDLYSNGFKFNDIDVHFGIFLGTMDLQAKSYVLNMTMHNGQNGCITCEEPGETVKQGKGTARHYPYRSADNRHKNRASDDIKTLSLTSTGKKRKRGICGPSGLIAMPFFDLVLGIVPDYMHGVLLGVVKTLMMKFFSPTNSGKPYFVGMHLNSIAKRLRSIKPPDYIDRVPRNLVKHYQNFKASELQGWLLHYSLPCLFGYLPDKYLKHLAKLSEGIYILLCDNIYSEDLKKAERLLDEFYGEFAELYGAGSCGLNVHNIGAHLVFYVKKWGPLFGWSCFGFEDANADILSHAHGTKDVTKQIIRMSEAHMTVRSIPSSGYTFSKPAYTFLKKMNKRYSRQWTSAKSASNCQIFGAVTTPTCLHNIDGEYLKQKCAVEDMREIKQALRMQIGNDKYYSKSYTKMKKKVCYVVLLANGMMISVNAYIVKLSGEVFAVGTVISLSKSCFLFGNEGHHILQVEESDNLVIERVENIVEKLFFIKVDGKCYVSRTPNKHGHGVMK